MRTRAHELESQVRSLFSDSLQQCESGSEAATFLQSHGVTEMLNELAIENDTNLIELEQTAKPKVAILNNPELLHYAAILGASDIVLQQLLRAVGSPVVSKFFPHSRIWKSYSAAVVNLHGGKSSQVPPPKPKGHEEYYLPYINYMVASDAQELEAARIAVLESFTTRNRDRRFTDWLGLDGDGAKPVLWDFRMFAIDVGRSRKFV